MACPNKLIDPGTGEPTDKPCGDEGVLCDSCQEREAAYWLAYFGGHERIQREVEARRFYEEYGEQP